MLRGMAFAHLRALITNLRAEPAEGFGPLRVAAHPFGGEDAYVGAIAAEPDTTCHQIMMVVMLHADHVVCACFAGLPA